MNFGKRTIVSQFEPIQDNIERCEKNLQVRKFKNSLQQIDAETSLKLTRKKGTIFKKLKKFLEYIFYEIFETTENQESNHAISRNDIIRLTTKPTNHKLKIIHPKQDCIIANQ